MRARQKHNPNQNKQSKNILQVLQAGVGSKGDDVCERNVKKLSTINQINVNCNEELSETK
jgi:hypothetical protein